MTAPNQNKDNAAAVGFMALLALMAGGAGLVIAALAVGAQRAWSGNRADRPHRATAARDRVADHRSWLAQDRAAQAAWRQARRDWWANGADPEKKPATPSFMSRAGGWFRRTWARTSVRASEFRDGCRDGWRAADKVRRNGGKFGDIARARPGDEQATEAPDTAEGSSYFVYRMTCRRCGETTEWTRDHDGQDSAAHDHVCPDGVKPPVSYDDVHDIPDDVEAELLDRTDQRPTYDMYPDERPPANTATHPTQPNPATATPTEGDTMSTPTAVTGDTNAAVMAAKLEAIAATSAQVSEIADQLGTVRTQLDAQVRDAAEFAESTGQTAGTRQALDSASAVTTQIGQQVGDVSQAAEQAMDETRAAREGLRPVEQAEDALVQAGADGRAVAQAVNA